MLGPAGVAGPPCAGPDGAFFDFGKRNSTSCRFFTATGFKPRTSPPNCLATTGGGAAASTSPGLPFAGAATDTPAHTSNPTAATTTPSLTRLPPPVPASP